jgi:hypothetical protein
MRERNAADAKRLAVRESHIRADESAASQGLLPGGTAQELKANIDASVPEYMKPGNLGSVYRQIWPFWFTFDAPELHPNQNSTSSITVTQEAAFVFMSFTKSVFIKEEDPFNLVWVDPDDETAAGTTPGLKWTLRDAQSTRLFTQNPVDLDHVGHPRFPTVMPSPVLFLPNSTVEWSWFNNHPQNIYVPWVTFFGYRIRIEEAQNMLGTVSG